MARGIRAEPLARFAARSGRLAIAGHRVVLGVGEQRRTIAGARLRGEGGGHPGRTLLRLETRRAQTRHVPGGRLVLAPGRLGQVPDVLVPAGQFVHVSIDPLPGGLLGRTGQLSRTGQCGAHVSSSASNNDNGTCSRCTPPAPIASCNASGRSAAARIEVPVPPNAVTSAAQSGWSRRTPIGAMPRSASFSSISRYPPLSTHTTTRSRACSRAVMNSCTENISAPSPSTHTTGRWGLAIFAPIEAGNPYPRVA